jgi:hypothetical protein
VTSGEDLTGRIQRLDKLARGLAREVLLWKEGKGSLLYAERQEYLEALQDAVAGLEAARVALARAHQRIEDTKRKSAGPRPVGSDRTGGENHAADNPS